MKNNILLILVLLFVCYGLNAQSQTIKTNSVKNKIVNSIGMEFILIPSGVFMMGSPNDIGDADEKPQHKIKISKSFYMSKYPVTVEEFRKFTTESGYVTDAEKNGGAWVWTINNKWEQKSDANWKNPYFTQTDKNPVVCISWNDADAFVKWLSKKEKRNYELPSEAEFEYACRAGSSTPWHFGSDTLNYADFGWPQNITSQGFPTHQVGQKKSNSWGLFDMIGNAWQWCKDWYHEKYYSDSPEVDPQGPITGRYKVNRGGMSNDIYFWRSSKRDALSPESNYSNQTFRVIIQIVQD